jgi:hypothetical protein
LAAEVIREGFVADFTFDFFNDCTGELVPLSGVIRFREMVVETGGTFLRTFEIIQNASGRGEISGRLYKFNVSHTFEIKFAGANHVTEVDNAHVVTQGSIAYIHLLIHATRSATGEITVENEVLTVECR